MTGRRPGSAPGARMCDAQYKATVHELNRLVMAGSMGWPFEPVFYERPELVPSRSERIGFDLVMRRDGRKAQREARRAILDGRRNV